MSLPFPGQSRSRLLHQNRGHADKGVALKILTYTTLYPNSEAPSHGVFVENRLRHLSASGQVSTRVVAPVPWFPFSHRAFGRYGAHARVPGHETRHGLEVSHPRYPVIPKVGWKITPHFLFRATVGHVRRILKEDPSIRLIDAHYFYPDGVAAWKIAEEVGLPFVITGRGTDLNLIPQHRAPREMILGAAAAAAGLITVCAALKDALVDLGADGSKVRVLRNGVDLEQFSPPADREALRRRLGLTRPTLVSAGYLIERKGHHLIVEAMRELEEWDLIIVGDGEMRTELEQSIRRLGLEARVRMPGRIPHQEMRNYFGAADALVLASSREGWANVLLEAMACGTPVAATDIWGTPEVVSNVAAGVLIRERSARGIAEGVRELFRSLPDRSDTRRYAEGFSWEETTQGQIELFRSIAASHPRT